MEKIGEKSGSDQEQTNPREFRLSVQQCSRVLLYALLCKDGNCRVPCCQDMKRVVQHFKICKQKKDKARPCPICKRLVTICAYHAKWCQEAICLVPFCAYVKTRLRQEQRRLQQETLEKRFAALQIRRMCDAILQPFPGNSNPSSQSLSSLQPHTSPPSQVMEGPNSVSNSNRNARMEPLMPNEGCKCKCWNKN